MAFRIIPGHLLELFDIFNLLIYNDFLKTKLTIADYK